MATTIARCHHMIAKKSHRSIRIVVVLKDPASATSGFLEDLNDIPRDTGTVDHVTISVVDPTAATVNLLDLAVRGGTMANWLDVGAHIKRQEVTTKMKIAKVQQRLVKKLGGLNL